MRVGTKLAVYGVVLAAAFGAGAIVGAAVGPEADDQPAPIITEPEADHGAHTG